MDNSPRDEAKKQAALVLLSWWRACIQTLAKLVPGMIPVRMILMVQWERDDTPQLLGSRRRPLGQGAPPPLSSEDLLDDAQEMLSDIEESFAESPKTTFQASDIVRPPGDPQQN